MCKMRASIAMRTQKSILFDLKLNETQQMEREILEPDRMDHNYHQFTAMIFKQENMLLRSK